MNRKIYIGLGILINLVELSLPVIISSGWGILLGYLLVLVYLIGTLFISAANNYFPITFWFWAAKKRIYHDGFGTLWSMIEGDDKVEYLLIYKQRWMYQILLTKVEYTDNIGTLTGRTKMKLDGLYEKENVDKYKYRSFDEWDGYLDQQSKRDDKLNKLGVK